MTDKYQFTQDWFSHNIPSWNQIFSQLREKNQFLEIGSFEGRSTVWLIENQLGDGGRIVCVDTWKGGEEHTREMMHNAFVRFQHNIDLAAGYYSAKSAEVHVSSSIDALCRLVLKGSEFDFIYIDGSHKAKDVLSDACMSWSMLRSGGILIFDDYQWRENLKATHKPKMAIDAFLKIFSDEYRILCRGYQVAVQKI